MKAKFAAVAAHMPALLAFVCLAVSFVCVMRGMYEKSDYVDATAMSVPVSVVMPEDIVYPDDGIAPNTATAEELDLLPGVGEVISKAFITEREQNGPFYYPEDLLQIKGIGEKKLEKMRHLIKLP